jgi:hypothetical protein
MLLGNSKKRESHGYFSEYWRGKRKMSYVKREKKKSVMCEAREKEMKWCLSLNRCFALHFKLNLYIINLKSLWLWLG